MSDAKKSNMRQYEYRANSNLVLQLEKGRRPRDSEPTGEVTTLNDKFNTKEMMKLMGDHTSRGRPSELEARLKKRQQKKRDRDAGVGKESRSKARKIDTSINVLNAEVDAVYRPQTRDTKQAYEVLLTLIQKEMGDKPHDVLQSAADEVLAILKEENARKKEQRRDLEKLFGRTKGLDDERFGRFINVTNKISDYSAVTEQQEEDDEKKAGIDEEIEVPVVFDASDDDDDSGLDEVKEEDMIEEGVEADRTFKIASKSFNEEKKAQEEKMEELKVRDIDAFWLQRQLSEYYKDAHTAAQTAEKVFSILSNPENDNVACENMLVEELDYDKFSFIRTLRRNRLKIVYCMKLARAKGEEKSNIEKEMMDDAKLAPILQQLRKTSTAADRNTERERKKMREANRRMEEEEDTKGETFWNKRPKALLDLDSMTFSQGARFMSERSTKLPPNSEIINKKGYQEVHIPCLKMPPMKKGEKLVPFSDLPEWALLPFKGMKKLNRIQSQVYPCAFKSSRNMLICAPTGAGKTNCALLTILRVVGTHMNEDGTVNLNAFKIIYVAPMKSLAQEMVLNFGKRLKGYGIKVAELTGDSQLTKQQIDETQVLIVTPEKWDIITRKNGERTYTQLVKLVIIDEIHLLHDDRGPVLESIVARSIRQTESTQQHIRIVGLSATLPNYKDVAMFLRVKIEGEEKGLFCFDNSYRPCPLQQQYIGITAKKAFKRYQMMNEICYDKVLQNAGKQQVLVFVHSRKETATTAKFLRDTALENDELTKFLADDSGHRAVLQSEAESIKHEGLKELLPYGFAIHHAGMKKEDRRLVEELFGDRHIQVLVCTATLAWGVNLPAHTVIIKGTQIYSPEAGTWVELSPLDIMQMMGRAGRPQYDKFGEGILITSHSELHYYLSLLNEQLPIESQYIKKLADNLNAEIVMGTVQNVEEAVQWLGYTYLYVRMLRSPTLYGVDPESLESDSTLEQRRVDLIHSAATTLEKHNMVKYNRQTGTFQMTDLGVVSSHYYITHQSMAVFNEYMKPHMSDIELFRVFSLSTEFQYVSVRSEEKLELAKLLDKVPIPVKEGIDEPSAKVNVLLQAYISRLSLEGFALMSDMVYITQSAGRVMRAMFEIALKRGWAAAAIKTLNLCNMISHRMWGAQSPLRQFKGIPPGIIKRIEGKEFTWDRLYDLQAHAIGELVRFPSMGKRIHRAVHQLPRLELMAHTQPITRTVLRVELTITPDFAFDQKIHGDASPFWIIVEDVDGETILHHEYFILKRQFAKEQHNVNFTIPIHEPMPPQYFIRVVSDRWLGSETVLPLSFRHLLLPEKYAAPTELLDLQPLPLHELQNEKFISLYSGKFKVFNPIQTQVFNSIYKGDSNVLVCAPTGSGKTVCAELAIFRMLSQFASGKKNMSGRCVYIAPLDSLVDERYNDWKLKLGKLGLNVVKLTGEQDDLRTLKSGQIVISSPKNWDILSRRWKTRKDVQTVSLFIVDEIHLIGGTVGPILEVIVSRMRYIAAQTGNKIRVVALGTSVANAKDLGNWIGATSSNLYNFHPDVRPVPLEIRIQGFGINHFPSRMLAMSKPTHLSIKRFSEGKPVMIFVPSRKQATRASVELLNYVAAEEDPKRYLHADEKDIQGYLSEIKNDTLKHTLAHGVAFLHTGLSEKEKMIVHELYNAEAIQIVVVEHELCWGLTLSAHLVIVMGTEHYDGSEHRYVDYPITNVVQMMGRACRPTKDPHGKCSIFCHTPKKAFYKKFLYEPFPVESHLDHMLHNHLNAEIGTKTIEGFQDAVDYLTWSFMWRRLTQNPNYYNLQGTSNRHLSDHLSELVESTLQDLESSKCISVDEMDLAPLNLGMIASYYYINYTTTELFNSSLNKGTKMKGLIEILSHASEFESVPLRQGEERALERLSRRMPIRVNAEDGYHSPNVKTHLLLQSHFSRQKLSPTVQADRDSLLPIALRLLQSIVDVISSGGWLQPALAAMELSQMVVQGMWATDSTLMQIPHMTKNLAAKCKNAGVETIFDVLDMEDDDRIKLLSMSDEKLADVATMCNAYPNVELKYTIEDPEDLTAGGRVTVLVNLERDADDEDEEEMKDANVVEAVYSKFYPKAKNEAWWIVIGDTKKNKLLSIKRVTMRKKEHKVKMDFVAPAEGEHDLKLFFMCDSYLGCDQEFEFKIKVAEGDDDEDEDEDEDEEEGES
mmetsp:Transcript_31856/g.77625  ORF Transcript_31856/g.77625 Transcript_31856/m.77625 type:complete len:2179 (-) Transcript_31856:255-6791(-)|eukprot:CAMPEP_0114512312 /NCGR_PEP_ID=MMETSP0109-20121206/14903_1 /TAXON_ID=29199 /ORGANISM="Chlorarachnion reptans, Strain CCCM449" /LENGTH=2178 /DNA_ID=CAMNT_0001691977 /DNA_START=101 /DNA_END=6637 /DNA_ORIENTATION=-